MRNLRIFAVFVSLLLTGFASTAHAAYVSINYSITGDLTDFKLFSASGVQQTATLDPSTTDIKSFFGTLATSGSGSGYGFTTRFQPDYHVVRFQGSDSATYAGLVQSPSSVKVFISGNHVTGGGGTLSTTWGIGSWCTSAQASTCASLYSEQSSTFTSSTVFNLLFTDSTWLHFNGTIVAKSMLSNGGWIERTYTLHGDGLQNIPVPMSGVLFGSAILALAGARRRRAS